MRRMPRIYRSNSRFSSALAGAAAASMVAAGLLTLNGCASRPVARAAADASSNRAAAESEPTVDLGAIRGEELSKVIDQTMNGLSAESDREREALIKQAKEYVRFRTGRMTLQEKSLRKIACKAGKIDFTLCDDILGEYARPDRARLRARKRSRLGSATLAKAITQGRLEPLKAASEAEILTALKRISKPSSLENAISAVDGEAGCLPSPMLSAIGLRMEQYLPDPRYKEKIIDFYSRADRCGGDDLATMRARYRQSLLQIADGRCEVAEPLLKKIAESVEGVDYRSRVYYWRSRCAAEKDDKELETAMRAKLLEEFPFSLHALLLSPSEGPLHMTQSGGRDPKVSFRSEVQPELNRWIRAIEAVQTEGGSAASFRLIETVLERMGKAEPSFQLYVAVLLRRSGDVIRKFQLLSGLLKRHPELSSKASLEMLYPLQQFELVRSHVVDTDPYLVLSLIRQESAFNTAARSPAGAMGLMQLMPGTARRMERVNKKALLDPHTNVRLGVRFFSGLIERYSGDVELALAAYNAGPLRADEWVKRYPFTDRMLFVDMIPFKETRDYVASIARNYYWYVKLYESETPSKRASDRGAFAVFRSPASE